VNDYRRYYLLADWPHWARGLLVIVITVLLVILLLMFLPDSSAPAPAPCVDDRMREEIRTLTLEAVDTGLKEHVAHLFEVWVRDPAEQPKRATVGMQNGISAYLRARQNALLWNPPSC
jgi:hypothetical protein